MASCLFDYAVSSLNVFTFLICQNQSFKIQSNNYFYNGWASKTSGTIHSQSQDII